MTLSRTRYRLGLVLVTLSAVAWSTAGLFTRIIDLDLWTMLAWRGIFGAIGIAAVIAAIERRNAIRAFLVMTPPTWVYAIVSGTGMILFIAALRHTTVAHVAVIYATAPLIAAALGWLVLRERPGSRAIAASIAALAGVACMVGLGAEGDLLGDLLALAMTVSMAVLMIIARRHPDLDIMPAACLSALGSGLVCWPLGTPTDIGSSDIGLLVLFGLTNSAVGLSLFTLGAKYLPPVETALIGALDAPLAPLWVWLAFAETPGHQTIAGALIVFGAVAFHIATSAAAGPARAVES